MSNDGKVDDVEAPLLYPSMEEFSQMRSQMRWEFIRRVYSILIVQLLATIAVAACVAYNQFIAVFFGATWLGLGVYIAIIIIFIMLLCVVYAFQHIHPINFILLGILTVCVSLILGLIASFIRPILVLEAASATLAVVVSLTVYAFWVARRGGEFQFLIALCVTIAVTAILLIIFQIFFPLGKISWMLYNGLCILVVCVYIIFDTLVLMGRYQYYEYIWASVMLYLDIIYLFFIFLRAFRSTNRRIS